MIGYSETYLDYLSEVEAGDVIYMQGAIVSAGGKKLACKWKLYDQATDRPVMKATALYVCMDLEKRRSRDIPQHLLDSVQKVLVKEED
jgi:acyl-CoA thioesterase FadM